MREIMKPPFKSTVLLLGLFLLSCSRDVQGVSKLEKLLPQVEGWKLAEKPKHYTHDNLFDYINGNCELYFSYGFQGLVSALYSNSRDPNKTVTIDIYDMGSPLNAFGVYSSMSHPDLTFESIGCEATVSPLQVKFWQDRYEVEINSGTTEGDPETMVRSMAKNTSENLPGCQLLPQVSWLPEKDQIAHTLKYVADGFLGQGFLPGGLEAVYKVEGKEVRGFLSNCGNEDQAKRCLDLYRESLYSFSGMKMEDFENHFVAYHQYTGYMWTGYQGPWFYGAISQTNASLSRELAEVLKNNLTSIQ